MRKEKFVQGEFYHVFNRGVDKRQIFLDQDDLERFFISMKDFNNVEPINSIYEHSFIKKNDPQLGNRVSKLVEFVCYCLNPNHYHFILKQNSKKGIEKFMHRVGLGYTKYFNQKNSRSGSLFQGAFKAVHISKNRQLLHLSAYVNLNYKVHQLGNSVSKLVRSSWDEYMGKDSGGESICNKNVVLSQFDNKNEYKKFAESTVKEITKKRRESKETDELLIE